MFVAACVCCSLCLLQSLFVATCVCCRFCLLRLVCCCSLSLLWYMAVETEGDLCIRLGKHVYDMVACVAQLFGCNCIACVGSGSDLITQCSHDCMRTNSLVLFRLHLQRAILGVAFSAFDIVKVSYDPSASPPWYRRRGRLRSVVRERLRQPARLLNCYDNSIDIVLW